MLTKQGLATIISAGVTGRSHRRLHASHRTKLFIGHLSGASVALPVLSPGRHRDTASGCPKLFRDHLKTTTGGATRHYASRLPGRWAISCGRYPS